MIFSQIYLVISSLLNSPQSSSLCSCHTLLNFSSIPLESLESIEDYIVLQDYLHPVNQTYEIKLRQEGFSNITPKDIESQDGNGNLEKLRRIWQEHRNDDWGEFNNEEITRYICEKISLGETSFLSDKTKDQFRSLYRLIAERIRQYQNVMTRTDLDKFQKNKA